MSDTPLTDSKVAALESAPTKSYDAYCEMIRTSRELERRLNACCSALSGCISELEDWTDCIGADIVTRKTIKKALQAIAAARKEL